MAATDPGGVPGEPGWDLPSAAVLSARTVGEVLQALAQPLGQIPADRIAAALAVLPPGPIAGDLIETCDPADPAISPLGRLRLIAAANRQVAYLQARQDQWIASFARPGVSMPMERLLDLVCDGRRGNSLHPAAAELIPLDVRSDPVTFAAAVADRPDWQAALADGAEKAAAAEVGAVLGISPASAGTRVRHALLLADEFPSTLEAQLAGRLDQHRARIIAGTFSPLSSDSRPEVEAQAIADSNRFTPAQFGDHCERLLIAADPDAARRRAEDALADRRIRRYRGLDGMGRFTADVPADKALLAAAVLDDAASRFSKDLRGGRTVDQLRADIFSGIFTNLAEAGHVDLRGHLPDDAPETDPQPDRDSMDAGRAGAAPPSDPAPASDPAPTSDPAPWNPTVALTVTIAASTLARLDDDPAQLAGHGWIHPDLARSLGESAATIRLAINREDSSALTEPPDSDAPADSSVRTRPPDGDAPADSSARTESARTRPRGADLPAEGSARRPWDLSAHRREAGHEHCTGDATCGGTLDHGREVYRPPAAVKDYVISRDRSCRHPGCTRRAERCDIDHRRPYNQGGPTCPCNLEPLCRFHHRAKTFLGWTPVRLPGNHLRWTTPHGYTVTDHPEPQPTGRPFTPTDLATALADDPAPF